MREGGGGRLILTERISGIIREDEVEDGVGGKGRFVA